MPVSQLLAVDEDGTELLDLTPYLIRPSVTFRDELEASQATFSIVNASGNFSKFGGDNATILEENRKLIWKKGFTDPVTGTALLIPAYVGRITQVRAGYDRKGGQPTLEVSCLGLLKNSMKQKATTDNYANMQVNLILGDIAARYTEFGPSQQEFADLDYVYGNVQMPDFPVPDMLSTLMDPLLFYVREGEDGKLLTGPRLGTALQSGTQILGYPDAEEAPTPIQYVIPDNLVVSISEMWQDHQSVNQVRVLGQAEDAVVSLGPDQVLHEQQDSEIAYNAVQTFQCYFGQHTGSASNVLAENVYVTINYSTTGTDALDSSPETVTLGPFADSASAVGQHVDVHNSDGHKVMTFQVMQLLPTYLVLKVIGRGYSSGLFHTTHHGGGDYNFTVNGQPQISTSVTLTAIKDYHPATVTGETGDDAFGDHQTFQFAHAPFAMGTTVELFIGGTSQGKNSADQQNVSLLYKVDWERGRCVLKTNLYRVFVADDGSTQPTGAAVPAVTGGTAATNSITWTQDPIGSEANPTPASLYQSNRHGEFTYVFGGLTVGQSYDLTLHFADPTASRAWDGSSDLTVDDETQRVFDVYVNGAQMLHDYDIYAKGGGQYKAVQETISGQTPDSDGNITVLFTAHDPLTGYAFHPYEGGSTGTHTHFEAIVSGIEVLMPQGQGADPYAVNAGGPAINPTAPTVTCNYGYSAVQEEQGIQNLEINNPLIATQEACESIAQFFINYAAWSKNQMDVTVKSLPHLQPGDLIQFYHKRINKDVTAYLESISRTQDRSQGDNDTLSTYVLYAQSRS